MSRYKAGAIVTRRAMPTAALPAYGVVTVPRTDDGSTRVVWHDATGQPDIEDIPRRHLIGVHRAGTDDAARAAVRIANVCERERWHTTAACVLAVAGLLGQAAQEGAA